MSADWIDKPLDLLLGYTPGMVMPKVRRKMDRPWHPEDAFHARNNENAHWMWATSKKRGDRQFRLWERVTKLVLGGQALDEGRRIVRAMIEKGEIDMSDVLDADKARAEEALGYCVAVVKDGSLDHKHRLSAARTLLDFSRAKPAAKAEVTIKSAEDWLDIVAESGDGA